MFTTNSTSDHKRKSPAEAGTPEDARKAIMGHVDIATTAGYTHWTPQALGAITGAVVSDFGPEAS